MIWGTEAKKEASEQAGAALMPTLWKWKFCEGIRTKGRGGEQRAFAGDSVVVVEPDLGVCTLANTSLGGGVSQANTSWDEVLAKLF